MHTQKRWYLCVMTAATCAGISAANCTGSEEGKYYLSGTTYTLASGTTLIASANCGTTTVIGLTPAYYEGINAGGNTCSANSDLIAFVEKLDACTGYAIADCLSGINKTKCIVNAGGDGCEAYDDAASDPCPTVKLFKIGAVAISYIDGICKLYDCQAKADKSGCEAITPPVVATPTCASYTGLFTYVACIGFFSTCTVNLAKTTCIAIKHSSTDYTTTECAYAKNEQECLVSGTSFVQKNCDSAASTVTTLAGCQAGSTNCVIRVGGCQFRANCASYKVQGTCVKNACGLLQQLNLLIKVVVQPKHQLVLIVILNVQPLENVQSKQLQTRKLFKVVFHLLLVVHIQLKNNNTTKKDAGCTLKGACTSANVATASTTNNNKNVCQWDTEVNNCRLKECQDFAPIIHQGKFLEVLSILDKSIKLFDEDYDAFFLGKSSVLIMIRYGTINVKTSKYLYLGQSVISHLN